MADLKDLSLYVASYIDIADFIKAKRTMGNQRCPLRIADDELDQQIENLAEEYCFDNDISTESMWKEIDTDDILMAI